MPADRRNPFETAYQILTANNTAAPAVVWDRDAAPARGPDTPGSMWIEPASDGDDVVIMRVDGQGYKYTWSYMTLDDMQKVGPLIMGFLAKRAHEGG